MEPCLDELSSVQASSDGNAFVPADLQGLPMQDVGFFGRADTWALFAIFDFCSRRI
jgi:hypothetical protein